jgi:S-DNA-T family DNA segregation ATPase FtsK/SpoIIIE
MHLVIATQRPSVDVITGIIKANIPSRISFAVSSQVDSRTILDMVGAEKLLGKGDMLFYPSGAPKPTRIQGAFVSDGEVEKIVDFLKANGEVTYNEDIIESIENANNTDKEMDTENSEDDDTDPLLMEAIDVVVETQQASTSFIQRRFKVGYARAGRIIDQMEERGVISGYQGSKPREVLLSKERLAELKMATMPENTQEE